jgi:hypothetical protein
VRSIRRSGPLGVGRCSVVCKWTTTVRFTN